MQTKSYCLLHSLKKKKKKNSFAWTTRKKWGKGL